MTYNLGLAWNPLPQPKQGNTTPKTDHINIGLTLGKRDWKGRALEKICCNWPRPFICPHTAPGPHISFGGKDRPSRSNIQADLWLGIITQQDQQHQPGA